MIQILDNLEETHCFPQLHSGHMFSHSVILSTTEARGRSGDPGLFYESLKVKTMFCFEKQVVTISASEHRASQSCPAFRKES